MQGLGVYCIRIKKEYDFLKLLYAKKHFKTGV
jgi:hypothetical protein